jgi:hypothetical protein
MAASPNSYDQQPSAAPAYRRQTPHVTQPPIDDVETQYVTRERYQTLEQQTAQAPAKRRISMGRATSNPDYLPLTADQLRRDQEAAQAQTQEATPLSGQVPANDGAATTGYTPAPHTPRSPQPANGQHRQLTHSARYLQTPKPGRNIFVSPYTKRRRSRKRIVLVVAVAAVIAVLAWLVFLR